MTPTESAYIGGIIDGEGCIEFKWANRIRRDRKGTPDLPDTYCPDGGASSRQTTHRLPNGNNKGRDTGHQTLPQTSHPPGPAPLARGLSWRLPNLEAGLQVFNCEERKSKTCR